MYCSAACAAEANKTTGARRISGNSLGREKRGNRGRARRHLAGTAAAALRLSHQRQPPPATAATVRRRVYAAHGRLNTARRADREALFARPRVATSASFIKRRRCRHCADAATALFSAAAAASATEPLELRISSRDRRVVRATDRQCRHFISGARNVFFFFLPGAQQAPQNLPRSSDRYAHIKSSPSSAKRAVTSLLLIYASTIDCFSRDKRTINRLPSSRRQSATVCRRSIHGCIILFIGSIVNRMMQAATLFRVTCSSRRLVYKYYSIRVVPCIEISRPLAVELLFFLKIYVLFGARLLQRQGCGR